MLYVNNFYVRMFPLLTSMITMGMTSNENRFSS